MIFLGGAVVDLNKMRANRDEKIALAKKWYEDLKSARDAASGGHEFSEWEQEFLENVGELVEENRRLSTKQLEQLEKLWDKLE